MFKGRLGCLQRQCDLVEAEPMTMPRIVGLAETLGKWCGGSADDEVHTPIGIALVA
jgi:hypothetical protein